MLGPFLLPWSSAVIHQSSARFICSVSVCPRYLVKIVQRAVWRQANILRKLSIFKMWSPETEEISSIAMTTMRNSTSASSGKFAFNIRTTAVSCNIIINFCFLLFKMNVYCGVIFYGYYLIWCSLNSKWNYCDSFFQ